MRPNELEQRVSKTTWDDVTLLARLAFNIQCDEFQRQNKLSKDKIMMPQSQNAAIQPGYSSASEVEEHSRGVAVGGSNQQSRVSLAAPSLPTHPLPQQPSHRSQQKPVERTFNP